MDPVEGIAAADATLGQPFPLPRAALPLARWVAVTTHTDGAEVEWNLDDTRPGTPGRLALYAGRTESAPQLPGGGEALEEDGLRIARAALTEAQTSLRPAVEIRWRLRDLHLRLTAQGPWEMASLLAIARSVR